jgi:hypothetical protein
MSTPKNPVTVLGLVESDIQRLSEEFGMLLFSHLMVERVLEEILAHAGRQHGEDWEKELEGTSFFRKVGACKHRTIEVDCRWEQIVSNELGDALLFLNDLRNRIAHRYNEPLSYAEVHEFARRLEAAGVEFTDHLASSEDAARDLGYDAIFPLLHESTKHLVFELGFKLQEAGGPDLVG